MITTATVTTIVLTDHSRTVCHSWIEQRDWTLSARLQFLISTHLKLQPRRAIAVWYFEFLRISNPTAKNSKIIGSVMAHSAEKYHAIP